MGVSAGPFGAVSSTTTVASGFFSFSPQFASPGNYLVVFSKVGYATQKYVVTASGTPIDITATLSPGAGSLSGLVSGPGALSAAQRSRSPMAR